MKYFFFRGLLAYIAAGLMMCSSKDTFNEATEVVAIKSVLKAQEKAWNEGNLEKYMEGYWKSDSLLFIGSQVTTGWETTLERYKKGYPDKAAMGELTFVFYKFQFLTKEACLVTGKYTLDRTSGALQGMFTLLLRKKESGWVIVYDHTG